MELAVGPAREIDETAQGRKRVVSIAGGHFSGERMSGEVLLGEDCITESSDGTINVDVRVLLLTTDGQNVLMRYHGYRHGPATVMARLVSGEDVDPVEYYFRISPTFEVAKGRYEWLGRTLTIGTGRRRPGRVVYDIYTVD